MIVHIFNCNIERDLHGGTLDRTGSNLPTDICDKWVYFKTIEIEKDSPPLIGADPKEIIAQIEERGYFIGGTKITITEKIVPNN